MSTPNPEPTVEQLEIVAEILLVPVTSVLGLVSNYEQEFADIKWTRTIADIAKWPALARKANLKKIGSLEFFEGVADTAVLNFRNTLRQRYGLPLIGDEVQTAGATVEVGFVTGSVSVSSDW